MKTTDQYTALLKQFQKEKGADYGIQRIGIFGSVARGTQKDDSDVDVYYEGRALSLFKLAGLKYELEDLLGCSVDIVRLRESMNSLLRRQIEKEGVLV